MTWVETQTITVMEGGTGQSFNVTNTKHVNSLTELFIEDFEIQNQQCPFEKESREGLKKRAHVFFSLYILDFLLSHLIIGMRYVKIICHKQGVKSLTS